MRKAIFEENTDTITNADEIPIMSARSSAFKIYLLMALILIFLKIKQLKKCVS